MLSSPDDCIRLPTLDEFIRAGFAKRFNNGYAEFPGFRSLYVRFGKRCVKNVLLNHVLDIANIEASRPGSGALSRMISHLDLRWPNLSIFVENVLNVRFARFLARTNWQPLGPPELPCFFHSARQPTATL